MRLLFVYGGVALDLDLLSLGKPLPKTGSRQGFTAWTCQEVNRPAGRLFHRTEPLVNFGAIGSEPALTWMGNLEQRLQRHWVSWVVRVMRGEQQEPDWATWGTCGRVVMHNQRELTKAVTAAQPGCSVSRRCIFIHCIIGCGAGLPWEASMDPRGCLSLEKKRWCEKRAV